MASKTKRARFCCIDPRGPEALAQEPRAYTITVAGGSLFFVNYQTVRQAVFLQLEAANGLAQGLEELDIEDHWDSSGGSHGCGAYNAVLEDDSREIHEATMRQARNVVLTHPKWSHLRVRLLLRDFDLGTVVEVPVKQPQLEGAIA